MIVARRRRLLKGGGMVERANVGEAFQGRPDTDGDFDAVCPGILPGQGPACHPLRAGAVLSWENISEANLC